MSVLKFAGTSHFKQKIVCSTLANRPIVIYDIRVNDAEPGLRDHELSLLRLIEKISNGCVIEINDTGTRVGYKPGYLIGGKITHDCPVSRGISYYMEALLCLAPFGKQDLHASLSGLTNDDLDPSVDVFRSVLVPLAAKFGLNNVEVKLQKRGAPPKGGGKVFFSCPIVKELSPVQLLDCGLISRIRGIAYTAKVSPQQGTRMIETAKTHLRPYTENVFIYSDHYRSREEDSGQSAGYGLSLVAESSTGALYSVDLTAAPQSTPEELAKHTAFLLLQEISHGGYVDSTHQTTLLLFMTLCHGNVSTIRLGKLSSYTIQYLRYLKQFFSIEFKVEEDRETGTVLMTCLATNYHNLARKIF